MWQSYLNGMLVAFGLIMAIGAQNAFVLAQSLRREHHLPVAALCIVCDALLVAAGVFGLATVLAHNPTLLAVARWGGVVFLTWYGLQALRRACARQSLTNDAQQGVKSLRTVLLSALAVTLLNPHVYLDTVLLIGSLGAQQTEPGAYVAGGDRETDLAISLQPQLVRYQRQGLNDKINLGESQAYLETLFAPAAGG